MADSSLKVREVAWNELFPWLMLLRTVRISLMARVLVLGAAGLVVARKLQISKLQISRVEPERRLEQR